MPRVIKAFTVGFVSLILVGTASSLARLPFIILGVVRPETQFAATDPLSFVVSVLSLALLASGIYFTVRVGKMIWRYGA